MNVKHLLAGIAAFVLLPEFVIAEQTEIIITANRYPTSIEQVGSSVSVINKEEIKRHDTVLEALRTRVPGLEVSQIGGQGRTTSVFIRGAESDHTLVLIDGIRANDNTTDQFDFANLKSENIERIEVLRGPQSVLYGSSAIGGVINIITNRASVGSSKSVSLEAGSHGTQHYKGNVSWGSENISTSNTVSYFDTDGISAAASDRGNPEDDSYENISLSSRNDLSFSGDGKASLSLRYSDAETELDGFDFLVGAVDDPNFVQETDSLSAALLVSKPINDYLTPSVELGFSEQDLKGIDPDTVFNNFDIESQTLSVVSKLDLEPSWGGVLTLGHSYEDREGRNVGSFDERRDVNSFFLQKQYSWNERVFLTAGLRHDDDSDFGNETTYRTTLAVLCNETGTRFHASYGTGFKAPSFNELFFPGFGNPDLDAETSWGYDVGIEKSFANSSAVLDVTYFQSKVDDLIAFDVNTFLAENIAEAESKGIETTLDFNLLDWLSANVAYTYTKSEDRSTGAILPRRPRHRGSFNLLANPIEDFETTLSFLLVNSRRDSNGAKMDNYERVDLTFSYLLSDNLKPFVRIENLFDEDYEEIPGYGTLGFSAYAGIQANF